MPPKTLGRVPHEMKLKGTLLPSVLLVVGSSLQNRPNYLGNFPSQHTALDPGSYF